MEPIAFTPQVVGGTVGILLALLFAYFPALNVLYAGLKSEIKSLIMIGLLLATAVVIVILANAGIIQTTEPVSWIMLAKVFVAALITNQPMYTISPQTPGVRHAKAERLLPG